eukprot:1144527-Pelagomonas_calceolata.AAC.2
MAAGERTLNAKKERLRAAMAVQEGRTVSERMFCSPWESIAMLKEEGFDNVVARHHRLAEGVRHAVAGWGLKTLCKEDRWKSDSLTVVETPGVDSNKLCAPQLAPLSISDFFGLLTQGAPGRAFLGLLVLECICGLSYMRNLCGCLTFAANPATPVLMAHTIVKAAFAKYDLSLGVGLSKINGKVFRIGEFLH